ncbi:hypothetical protein X777_11747 [Ooceraea biroi]|uniref:Uncharacterized protein n=1 Tax=Ooceraea biroi TaxID=2015173 RepID=A0A026W2P8_OOCBI|nr:hypothetical protein X777_11747 [Ooceraea biroi]
MKEPCNGTSQSESGSDPSNTSGPSISEDAELLFLKRKCDIAAATISHLKLKRKKQWRNINRILYETNRMKREMQLWEETLQVL